MTPALLLLFVPADVPGIPATVGRSLDLTLLSHRQAQQFDGQCVRIRVDLESEPGDAGVVVVYDCVSLDAVNRTDWLVPGEQVREAMDVEGVFRLPCRPPDNAFAGHWEYRNKGAARRLR
jgi:hypothetical protein